MIRPSRSNLHGFPLDPSPRLASERMRADIVPVFTGSGSYGSLTIWGYRTLSHVHAGFFPHGSTWNSREYGWADPFFGHEVSSWCSDLGKNGEYEDEAQQDSLSAARSAMVFQTPIKWSVGLVQYEHIWTSHRDNVSIRMVQVLIHHRGFLSHFKWAVDRFLLIWNPSDSHGFPSKTMDLTWYLRAVVPQVGIAFSWWT